MSNLAIVLAAGKGTRMKSNLPKVLHKVNGVPMLEYVMKVLNKAGVEEIVPVLGHKKERIVEALEIKEYVVQEEQLGTGHAVMQAMENIKKTKGNIIVCCGDTPLLKVETIKNFLEDHKSSDSDITILTAEVSDPFGYGRIKKDFEGNVSAIVEEKEANKEEKEIREINTGVYCFKPEILEAGLGKIENKNTKGEYYLTDIISIAIESGGVVSSKIIKDEDEILGINDRIQLSVADKILKLRKNEELMQNGVTILEPELVFIEGNVEVGQDSIIHPNVTIQGNTKIGNETVIIGNTRIIDCVIGNNVEVEASVLEESEISDKVKIGPFAHLRPKSVIGKGAKVGNFVEIKKSVLQEGVKAGHLTYIGDSEVGARTNFGAGTVTCNYDGKNKFKTIIGEDVFIGSNTKFVAPVKVGDNVLIGAGSVITDDVEENSLAIARARQIVKAGWKKNKNSKEE